MKLFIREIIIYFAMLTVLAFMIHFKACIYHPIEHIKAINTAPFGAFHPFLFTFIVYIVILVIRIVVGFVRKRV